MWRGRQWPALYSFSSEGKKLVFGMFSEFVRNQLRITPSTPSGRESVAQVIRVCLVIRTGSSRNFRNVSELKLTLEARDPDDDSMSPVVYVDVVDFDGLTLRQQIEALIKPSPAFIIMTHGAAQINLLYLDEFTASNTNIIEICPPYSHCVCLNSVRTALCPSWYYNLTRFLEVSYYGYAVEDEQLSCQQYCDSNKNHDPGEAARKKVRDPKYVTVSAHSLRSMMYDIIRAPVPPPKEMNFDNPDRLRVHRADFGRDVRQKYADLRKVNGPIQAPDIN